MDVIKDIYLKQGRPDEYVDLMKKNGINVSVTEADSLSYAVGAAKYDNEDCIAAVKGFDNYLKRYPEGSFSLDALYLRSDCYRKSKDWQKALDGYKLVNEKGPSKYFDKATLEAARICYFELKDYAQARQYFESLHSISSNPENTQEALRGLVRSLYQLKDYTKANDAATELIAGKNISTDDRSIGYLVLGKSQQLGGNCAAAINSFKSVTAINKAAWGAEARYEMASCYFSSGNLNESEKSALSVIKETSAFDLWVTKAYLLLGDIFMQEEDYFNAKATYESVSRNAALMDLRNEARQKLDKAVAAEKVKTKIKN
jgi:tetratricopeptide (TPR) repeat protein